MRAEDGRVNFRLPADLMAALRKQSAENGESLSNTLRRAALKELGICPTCGQKAPELREDPC